MLSVIKIGGSVLRDDSCFEAAARFLAKRAAAGDERLVVIVSARHGVTDALLAEAREIADTPAQDALDLLSSTGELRSTALLALQLQRLGVRARALNVHQTGLSADGDRFTVRPLFLLAALGTAPIVIVPGFLAVAPGGTIRSLGRGGSDLTAVLLAASLRADRCELIKDVPGYFTADPHADADARPIAQLAIDEAIAIARAGCALVQPAALEAARNAGLPLIVRSLDAHAPATHVRPRSQSSSSLSIQPRSCCHGVRDQDHPRGATIGA